MASSWLHQIAPTGGWHTTEPLRIALINRANASASQRFMLGVIRRVGRLDATNLWLLLMNNVRLMKGFISFARKLMPFGELERQDTELVILRVAWNCRCRYEWGQHVQMGLRAGLSVDDIVRVSKGADAEGWSPRQKALLEATDEIHRERIISESTWARLTEFFDKRLLLELLMLIGLYEALAGVLNSAGLPLDASLETALVAAGSKNG